MEASKKIVFIKDWILKYVDSMPKRAQSLVIGISGGIDSSLVVALMQSNSVAPINTFSVGFEDQMYNEAPYAKQISNHLRTNHTELYLSSN